MDKCHHGKEEDLLFPAMEKALGGFSDGRGDGDDNSHLCIRFDPMGFPDF